jgi:hypothetical protein
MFCYICMLLNGQIKLSNICIAKNIYHFLLWQHLEFTFLAIFQKHSIGFYLSLLQCILDLSKLLLLTEIWPTSLSNSPKPQPLITTILSSLFLGVWLFYNLHLSKIIQYLSFCVSFISLNIMSSSSKHVVANVRIFFIFNTE